MSRQQLRAVDCVVFVLGVCGVIYAAIGISAFGSAYSWPPNVSIAVCFAFGGVTMSQIVRWITTEHARR